MTPQSPATPLRIVQNSWAFSSSDVQNETIGIPCGGSQHIVRIKSSGVLDRRNFADAHSGSVSNRHHLGPRLSLRSPPILKGARGRDRRRGPCYSVPMADNDTLSHAEGLTAQGLHVQYGGYHALTDVALALPRGQYSILVGENGAGKSTLLRSLAGWQRPQKGVIAVNGLAAERHERDMRGWVKLVPDTPQFYPELTAWEHLTWVAEAHSLHSWQESAASLLHVFGLDSNRRAYPSSFSRGMQYKLALAMTLLTQPAVILLDEPFGPLDPYSQEYLAKRLREAADGGTTVMASTHVLPKDYPPDRFIVLDQGTIIDDVVWEDVSTRYADTSLSTIPYRLLKDALKTRRGSSA